jgi:hypothetical protein
MLRSGYRPVKLGSYKARLARRDGLDGASVGNPGDACRKITVFIGLQANALVDLWFRADARLTQLSRIKTTAFTAREAPGDGVPVACTPDS